jgi:hypothetical protein
LIRECRWSSVPMAVASRSILALTWINPFSILEQMRCRQKWATCTVPTPEPDWNLNASLDPGWIGLQHPKPRRNRDQRNQFDEYSDPASLDLMRRMVQKREKVSFGSRIAGRRHVEPRAAFRPLQPNLPVWFWPDTVRPISAHARTRFAGLLFGVSGNYSLQPTTGRRSK